MMFGLLLVRNPSLVRRVARTAWLMLLVVLVSALANRATAAQSGPPVLHWVRNIEPDDTALARPVGLAFSPHADTFYIVERGAAEGETATTTIIILTAYGERLGSVALDIPPTDSLPLTYDNHQRRLLLWNTHQQELLSVAEHSDGALDPATLTRHAAAQWDVKNAVGMTFDTTRGHLYLLDRVGPRLLRIVPPADGNWTGATVTALDLAASLPQPQGLAYDPTSDHLHILAWGTQTLVELTLDGDVVAERDLAGFRLSGVGGLLFAPSADLTDDPQQYNLFFAGLASPERSAQRGQFVEFSLVEIDQPLVQAAAFTPDLVQTMDASQWSPPSPDPAGIVYLPDSNTLLVSDGEVNETVTISQSGQLIDVTLYAGVNMWHITPTGGVVNTWNTLAFSDEPAGLALNPANQHLFISDDTGTRGIYELNPGPSKVYGNDDDTVTFFDSSPFGSKDPEGLEYVADLDVLFIIDGTNREVYRVAPGPNGVFDGVPPTGDDQVTHFDTLVFGLDDPKGIAYNPANGHLYAVGKPASALFEFTTAGALVQMIDIAHLNARGLDDLAFAPGSQNPSAMSIYIVARGIDNDLLPDRLPNDGMMYEISLTAAITDNNSIHLHLPLMTR